MNNKIKYNNKVPHDILAQKLPNIGIQGKLHEWLMNFVSGRFQYICMLVISQCHHHPYQFSVLKPLLFTIFIYNIY
jgi:hypothetical protein